MKNFKIIPCLTLAFFFVLPAASMAGETVYYLFRHAEKLADNPDPGLTEEGLARAENLAAMLKTAGVTRIFSSDYKRTRDTAGPLSEATGIEIEIYDPRNLPGFAEQLKEMDGVIIISGHSNTTPELTALLSGYETEPMEETEYDRLYMVTFFEGSIRLNTIKQD
ncbi:MAG: phosphoglycerate mutase family protein [Sphingomonadales bacterium]